MFADLSGFTALSETLDAEDLRTLQTELFEQMSATIQPLRRLRREIRRRCRDGGVRRPRGARGRSGARAARRPAAAPRGSASSASAGRRALGRPLALHIGIHTGPVVAGHLGSEGDAAYAVTGDTVNAASRLQSAAGAGQTVVSHATWLHTQHAFCFEPMGELALKGMAQPMSAYRLEAALNAPQSTRGLQAHGLTSALVGREKEMEALQQAFEQMRAGQRQLSHRCRGGQRQDPAARRNSWSTFGSRAGWRTWPCAAPPAPRSASAPTACRRRCCATPGAWTRATRTTRRGRRSPRRSSAWACRKPRCRRSRPAWAMCWAWRARRRTPATSTRSGSSSRSSSPFTPWSSAACSRTP